MTVIGLIHHKQCNIDSIARAVEACGGHPTVVRDADELGSVDRLILPGVGAFGAAMQVLNDRGLTAAVRAQTAAGVPLLGICLGMQLLATRGYENGSVEGLGLVPGEIVRLDPRGLSERIPHVGWNEVDSVRPDPLFEGVESGRDFYFVHSYHFRCAEEVDILATTSYCGRVVSAVRRGNVWGTQFHPEKSLPVGHRLLTNFIQRCAGARC